MTTRNQRGTGFGRMSPATGVITATMSLMLLSATGCGRIATAPGESAPDGGTIVDATTVPPPYDDGRPGGRANPPINGTCLLSEITTIPVPRTGARIEQTTLVRYALGGTIQAGRFTIIVPFCALARDTRLTVTDLSGELGYLACRITPWNPAFRKPVTLTIDLGGLETPESPSLFCVNATGGPGAPAIEMGMIVDADGSGAIAILQDATMDFVPGKTGW